MSRERIRKCGKHGTRHYSRRTKRGIAIGFLAFIFVIVLLCFCLGSTDVAEAADFGEDDVEVAPVEPEIVEVLVTEDEWMHDAACYIAKTLYGECNNLNWYEKSLVAWCILNRVDYEGGGFGDTVQEVVEMPGQFDGYISSYPITDDNYAVAYDVLTRWNAEKHCIGDVGRTLPKQYVYFMGDNSHNYFRDIEGNAYMFTEANPYD